ncbi:MAG: alpha/beta hydrolase [Candidatus Baltobacteraceae bacterium]
MAPKDPVSPIVRWRKAQGNQAGQRPPLLVLLHGRGADEHDLFSLESLIDPAVAVASVRAPLATDEGGYTWSESRSPGRYIAQSLRSSMTWLQGWLSSLDAGRNQAQQIYLFGFSAGMAMASALLLEEPQRYVGTVLLSGTLPFDTDVPIIKDRLATANVFYGHGSFDQMIPADLVKRTDHYLRETSGARLVARSYPIAHEISEAEMADIAVWLRSSR